MQPGRITATLLAAALLAASARAQSHSQARPAPNSNKSGELEALAEAFSRLSPAEQLETLRESLAPSAPRRIDPHTRPGVRRGDETSTQALSGDGSEPDGSDGTAPYFDVDNLQAPYTNLSVTPYRPMAVTADNLHFYAVNTHFGSVRFFDFATSTQSTWRTPAGPVSIAIWDRHPDGIERLLVVSRGSHSLTVFDRLTGEVKDVLELPFEPADLLVHGSKDRAFVSCSGARVVADIDLVALTVTSIPVPCIQPAWMSWADDENLLVAPLISGNNSTSFAGLESFVLDLTNLGAFFPGWSTTGLPDEDLFSINISSASVAPSSRAAGTLLFAHGVNPVSGNHWQLGIESLNRDPAMQTEPALNGRFALNRLTLTALPPHGGPVAGTHTQVELDDSNPATPVIDYNPALTVGQPTGLCFSSNGFGLACGVTTDNVVVLAPAGSGFPEGQVVFEWDLPTGSIPRSVMLDPLSQTIALVYCWGTNQVLAYGLAPFNPTPFVMDLGHDPAPAAVQRGREVFYDASHSLNNHLTCGSCHIDGTSDQLAWNLSDKPRDTKGALHTQTLMGIDRLAPFHWRGERPVLEDFGGAFTGLLGAAAPLTAQQFADFKAFVFSLRNPANIGADENRVLNDALALPLPNGFTGSAVNGEFVYINTPSVGAESCLTCHSLPTGSNNDLIPEVPTLITSQSHMETTAFNELEDKDMTIVPVVANGPGGAVFTIQKPLTGFGLLHDGTSNSTFDFVDGFGQLTLQERADVTEFMFQFDSGLAKAAHVSTLVNAAHPAGLARLTSYLLPQAQAGNCDLAVVGLYPVAGVPTALQWAYRLATDDFRADLASVAPVPAATFVTNLMGAGVTNLILGLPPGNAEKFAIDYDTDEFLNQDELALGTDPFDNDTDGDGALDGIEIQDFTNPLDPLSVTTNSVIPVVTSLNIEWVTAKNARVTFRTSEPCSSVLTYSTPAGTVQIASDGELEKVHNLIATELLPSTNNGLPPTVFHAYTGTLVVTDSSGNPAPPVMINFTSGEFFPAAFISPVSVTGALNFTSVTRSPGGVLDVVGDVRLDQKLHGPPALPLQNYVVVANILVDGVISAFTQTPAQPQSFSLDGTPFTALPGPFLITPVTGPTGSTTFNFSLSGLSTGQEVRFNIVAAYATAHFSLPYNPTAPNFGDFSAGLSALNAAPQLNWSLGDTPTTLRSLSVTY